MTNEQIERSVEIKTNAADNALMKILRSWKTEGLDSPEAFA